jgi:epoxyqueuosine reductase
MRATGPVGDPAALIRDLADAAGFDAVRIARVSDLGRETGDRLDRFITDGYHGELGWMAETAGRRRHPNRMWPEARSAIMLGMSYAPGRDPLAVLQERSRGAISVYAQGKDYHEIVKPRLKQVARGLAAALAVDVKVFVDTAPLMEKPLAALAGLGWQGKHTNLVSREHGSWLFLGSVLTTAELPPDTPEADHCGSCRRCVAACPTNAFPAPYRLDARRCISYLTIEHKGPIARDLRGAMGNRIFGCDDCLAVCPWNKFAEAGRESRFAARAETDNPPLAALLALDDAAFRRRFQGTPVKRTGRDRFVRNVLIAAGNSGDAALVESVEALLGDASALVRGAAVWALGRLASPDRVRQRHAERGVEEADPSVRAEWTAEISA